MEVISLQHRPAELIVPALQGVAGSDTQLTASGNQLIVRATPSEMKQLKSLIQQLDQPLAQFRISVRQQGQNNQNGRSIDGSYQYHNQGNSSQGGGIQVGRKTLDGKPLPSGSISSGSGRIQSSGSHHSSSVTVKQYSTRSSSGTTQQLSAVEGYPAYIETGQQIPLLTRYQDRYGSSVEQSYQPVVTGFYVTPTLSGTDRVTLDISTSKQSVDDNQGRYGNPTIKTAGYHSTITAPLGQWVDLGSTLQGNNTQSSGIVDRQSVNNRESLNLQLKIEKSR
ncbi:secretin N-terminal domain-containing protein [Pseudomaricurvus sp.]|uniref:secretin N-terminal domain-containing protein n=1 Tax=Pseudomaricurvus sp. TaxID=2004510 RepID=UPI003F6B9B70